MNFALNQAAVDDLYTFRDEFFEKYPIEDAHQKPSLVQQKLEECLKALDKLERKLYRL